MCECNQNVAFFTKNQVLLMNSFRSFWEQHDVWTRETINVLVFDQPNKELVIQRLLRNPSDGAKLFEPFYGKQVASQFETLIHDHLVIAAELVQAAINQESDKVENARKRWYKNADDISRFLSSINPYWTYSEWLEMMKHHLKLVEGEAVTLITKDYEANIALYDDIEEQSLVMADTMSFGIIQQFQVF